MHALYLISVFLHLIAAMIWIGGMTFLIIILVPAVRNHLDKAALIESTGIRFSIAGWIVLPVLLVTGIFNAYYRGALLDIHYFISSPFGNYLLLKGIIFLLIITLSAIHDFLLGTRLTAQWKKNPDDQKVKQLIKIAQWSGRVNFVLALIMVGAGVLLSRGGMI